MGLKVHQHGFWSAVQCMGSFRGIAGQDPSESKSNPLHVDIFHICFIRLRCIL